MRTTLALAAIAALTLAAGTDAFAAGACKDTKGKFITCPKPAAAAPAGARCKDAKTGKFAKCTAAGATPVTAKAKAK